MSDYKNGASLSDRNHIRLKFLVLMAVATPGIPEYLSGSWKLSGLLSHPFNFLFFLALNLGLYTMGALLIREFSVIYKRGWLSVFLLGCAYGIVEEGLALHTFFQVSGSPVGFLGAYGRFAGVDWVWAFGLAVFHAVFSITLPLLLLSTAFPEYSERRLVGRSGITIAFALYAASVVILNFVTNLTSSRPVPSAVDYFFSLVVPSLLVLISFIIPGNALHFRGKEGKSPVPLFLIGLLVYPVYNIFVFVPINPLIITRISPVMDITVHLFLFGIILTAMLHFMPRSENRMHKLALAAGLVSPLMIESIKLELNGSTPFIVVFFFGALILLLSLWMDVKKLGHSSSVQEFVE